MSGRPDKGARPLDGRAIFCGCGLRTKPLTYSAIGVVSRAVNVEWDQAKDLANQRKHDVSFGEAAELFTSGRE